MTDPGLILRSDPILAKVAAVAGDAEVWVAGGWIRDRLIGLRPVEIDLTVPGNAEDAAALATRLAGLAGADPHLLGKPPHAVWRLEGAQLKVEIWARGSMSVVEDCLRRDYSCNALQWRLPGGPIQDPAGGLADLGTLRLRAISRRNLLEDPVRLLRAARFMAQLPGFHLDPLTRRWIQELGWQLARAPRERIGQELLRTVLAPWPARGVHLLDSLGLLDAVEPMGAGPHRNTVPAMVGAVAWLERAQRTLLRWGFGQGALDSARLGALLVAWGPRRPHLEPFAWPQELRRHALAAAHGLPRNLGAVHWKASSRRELMARTAASFPVSFALALATARAVGCPLEPWRRWWRQWRRAAPGVLETRPLLRGDEVAALLGRPPGPWLGELLDALRGAQLRGEVRTAAGARQWLLSFPVPGRVGMMSGSE